MSYSMKPPGSGGFAIFGAWGGLLDGSGREEIGLLACGVKSDQFRGRKVTLGLPWLSRCEPSLTLGTLKRGCFDGLPGASAGSVENAADPRAGAITTPSLPDPIR
jgi:hypothetical protein